MVFYKEEYNTVKEAVTHTDGLTVLAFFYEVGIFHSRVIDTFRSSAQKHHRL